MATAITAATKPTLFYLKSKLKWNPLLHSPNPFQPLFDSRPMKPPFKISSSKSFGLSFKCSCQNKCSNYLVSNKELLPEKIQESPVEKIAKVIVKAIEVLRKPAVAALVVGLLLMYDPSSALAASGGRVGGQSFSSRSSYSSQSYSVPKTSSGSGFSYSAPYYAPSPLGFGGGVYVGPAVGFGSSFMLIMAGFAAFILVSGFLSDRSEGGVLTATERTTVLKLQVGLLGMGRSLQRDLDRIADTADTSTPEGLGCVLTETTLALLRHPDYCISAYSYADVKSNMEEGEKRFNQLSIEERGKFDEETLVNVNNIKKRSSTSLRASGFSNEYIVVKG